jgi:hypothetical protein
MLTGWTASSTPNSVAVLTHHNDLGRTGANLREQVLDTHNVNSNFAKFCPPTVANGKVYVATFSRQLCIYGLLPGNADGK